jgi:hypothetical protein
MASSDLQTSAMHARIITCDMSTVNEKGIVLAIRAVLLIRFPTK